MVVVQNKSKLHKTWISFIIIRENFEGMCSNALKNNPSIQKLNHIFYLFQNPSTLNFWTSYPNLRPTAWNGICIGYGHFTSQILLYIIFVIFFLMNALPGFITLDFSHFSCCFLFLSLVLVFTFITSFIALIWFAYFWSFNLFKSIDHSYYQSKMDMMLYCADHWGVQNKYLQVN